MLLTRNHITLQVDYTGSKVRVEPLGGRTTNTSLLRTFARGEELLAQLHLATTAAADRQAQLKVYFTGRGWQVREGE